MTKKLVLAIGSLVLLVLVTTACASTTPVTPQPTNTPYPTQVPPTATPDPIITPYPTLIPTSTPKPITWMQLQDFLSKDRTNWNKWREPAGDGPNGKAPYPQRYVCFDFAVDLATNARKAGLDALVVSVEFENVKDGHDFVEFNTSDMGLVWIEPQTDYAYVRLSSVPKALCMVVDTRNCWPQRVELVEWFNPSSCSHEAWTCVNRINVLQHENATVAPATPTVQPTSSPAPTWKRTLYDPLTENLFGWCESSQPQVNADGSKAQFFFDRNTYHVTFASGDKGGSEMCGPDRTYHDFNASIKAQVVSAAASASYGIVFGSFPSHGSIIVFWLTPDGRYKVDASDEHMNYTDLQEYTEASGFLANGEWNKLAVEAEGTVFTFFINDVFQTQLTYDLRLAAKGNIGVIVAVDDPRQSIDIRFSDYEVWEP